MTRMRLISSFPSPNFPPLREVLATPGEAKSHYDLGLVYANGQGPLLDYAEAVRWFRIAADEGYPPAQYALGRMYGSGQGVAQDIEQALAWYRKAADQDYAVAQYALARIYQVGEGARQDVAEATKWYRKAAQQGYANAQNELGVMYENGHGVPEDHAEAVAWYRKAADQGHPVERRGPARVQAASQADLVPVGVGAAHAAQARSRPGERTSHHVVITVVIFSGRGVPAGAPCSPRSAGC